MYKPEAPEANGFKDRFETYSNQCLVDFKLTSYIFRCRSLLWYCGNSYQLSFLSNSFELHFRE